MKNMEIRLEDKEFDNDWLDIQVPDEALFNPMEYIYSDPDPEEVMKKLYVKRLKRMCVRQFLKAK